MSSPHTIRVIAAAEDIDELRHVSNLVYLRWVLEVARDHSSSLGYDPQWYLRFGSVWVVRRHEIEYAHPSILGDEIAVKTWVDTWKGASCVRKTELVRTRDERLVAQAATTWAFVDVQSGRPTRIPGELRNVFAHLAD